MLKLLIILAIATVAIILGGMAAAWRRACVTIAHNMAIANWACDKDGATMPSVRDLSQDDIIRFTPRWVSARHIIALGLLLVTVVAAFAMLRWYVALPLAISTFALMEAAGFVFPNRNSPYYVRQVYQSFRESLSTAQHFDDVRMVAEFQQRIAEMERTFKRELELMK